MLQVFMLSVTVLQVIQLEEVFAAPPPPPPKVNYTDLDLSGASLNPSPVIPRPTQTQEAATDYAVIDFEATSAAARAGRDHIRRREDLERRDCRPSLSRAGSAATTATQQL